MKRLSNSDKDQALRLHTGTCDKLYRWSMWRMYLNEELSKAIASSNVFDVQSEAVDNVTSPYIKHPNASRYGRQMKQLFARDKKTESRKPNGNILSDNTYLVFGIPRVFLMKDIPDSVRALHQSSQVYRRGYERDNKTEYFVDELENIYRETSVINCGAHMSSNSFNEQNKENISDHSFSETKRTETIVMSDSKVRPRNKGGHGSVQTNYNKTKASDLKDFFDETHELTLQTEQKKTDDSPNESEKTSAPLSFASAILQQQQVLLNRSVREQAVHEPRNEKRNLWKTLREKRPEILLLKSPDDDKPVEKQRSKPNRLWSFIFHRKKDILQMKRTHHSEKGNSKHKEQVPDKPFNFADNFQRELADRLKARLQQNENDET